MFLTYSGPISGKGYGEGNMELAFCVYGLIGSVYMYLQVRRVGKPSKEKDDYAFASEWR